MAGIGGWGAGNSLNLVWSLLKKRYKCEINMPVIDPKTLGRYAQKLKKLRLGVTQYGKAPHKPIFLLTQIEQVEKGRVSENKFFITPEFVADFKGNFALLVNTRHKSDFIQPYYYLQSDGFWHIQTRPGEVLESFIRSFSLLDEKVDYGFFDPAFFALLADSNSRMILQNLLLDNYFPNEKDAFLKNKLDSSDAVEVLEKFLLNESNTIPNIFEHPEIDQETEFVRGGLFKKLVPQVYNHTCAITGMRLISNFGFSMIDACHIIPFKVSGDDRVTNGIALCPNLHRAFDRGLISVADDFKVLVSRHFADDETNPYSIKLLAGKPIALPFGDIHFPEKANFKWHREEVFKG